MKQLAQFLAGAALAVLLFTVSSAAIVWYVAAYTL